MLDTGRAKTVTEIIEREEIAASYVHKIIRLTDLAPDIAAAIMEGQQPKTLTLSQLMHPLPLCWDEQRQMFGI